MQLVNWSDALQPTSVVLTLSNEGVILFTNVAEGFQLENPLTGFNVLNGFCTLEENTIKAFFGKSYITVTQSIGQKYTLESSYGDIIIPATFEGFPEDYYITECKSNNKTNNIGDTLYLDKNYSLEITIEKYCKLKFVYINSEEIVRIKNGTYYYMPTSMPDGKRVFGWDCSDGNYYLYLQNVFVTSDFSLHTSS